MKIWITNEIIKLTHEGLNKKKKVQIKPVTQKR
jgi:hypothetical protein